MKKFLVPVAALLLFGVSGSPVSAYDPSYLSPQQLDLSKILAPSPTANSELDKRDLAEVLRLQQIRTPAQEERAVADNEQTLSRIVGEIFGEKSDALRSPKFEAFYKRLNEDTRAIFLASKDVWARPRPFNASKKVHAIGDLPETGSYPSGHSTRGYVTAIILSNMVPEKAAELFARGREYGENRVVAGVHYPTDVEAGRLSGSAIVSAFMQNDRFRKDFEDAKAELRQALGL